MADEYFVLCPPQSELDKAVRNMLYYRPWRAIFVSLPSYQSLRRVLTHQQAPFRRERGNHPEKAFLFGEKMTKAVAKFFLLFVTAVFFIVPFALISFGVVDAAGASVLLLGLGVAATLGAMLLPPLQHFGIFILAYAAVIGALQQLVNAKN